MYNCRFGLDTENPITLDSVDCSTSNYLTILQCRWSTTVSSSCDHGSDDVSVTCCELLTDNDYLALTCILRNSTTPNAIEQRLGMLQFCTETDVAFVHQFFAWLGFKLFYLIMEVDMKVQWLYSVGSHRCGDLPQECELM